ncbi:cytochrome P450 [Solirubrobacter phytolaccae]|uniref:Cytochrome P450 n=1 Tax=Solirubrobacter phytolaccae TaxID=1404360 RepID=A0A9X3S7Q6_9ACTN|nr:cytochrome P450 [Solirubrobacter phytolaccae]MDA0179466.1 cytochrome P450 [Solirubrobacter phytolaccae]
MWEPEVRADRHAFYARVRAVGAPVLQVHPDTAERFWIVARYADVRDGLTHPDLGHQLAGTPEPATLLERLDARQLINLDPPEHTQLRALVSRAFTPRAVAALEPRVVAIVDALIDAALERGTFDGVAELGEPMPVAVIAELIGVPEEDRGRFRAWSAAIMSGEDRDMATLAFAAWVDALADERAARPREDLVSALAALEGLAREDLIAMVQLLLIAGQETAVYTIVNGLRALLSHPEQWAALCADPLLAALAVEEILRFDGPVEIAPPRFAQRDVWLGGTIPAGERVGLALLGANRDPEVFSRPNAFDIQRGESGRQLGFGHGIHYCLGAGLGRLEARVMFRRLAERMPGLQLAEDPGGGWIAPHSGTLPLAVSRP